MHILSLSHFLTNSKFLSPSAFSVCLRGFCFCYVVLLLRFICWSADLDQEHWMMEIITRWWANILMNHCKFSPKADIFRQTIVLSVWLYRLLHPSVMLDRGLWTSGWGRTTASSSKSPPTRRWSRPAKQRNTQNFLQLHNSQRARRISRQKCRHNRLPHLPLAHLLHQHHLHLLLHQSRQHHLPHLPHLALGLHLLQQRHN